MSADDIRRAIEEAAKRVGAKVGDMDGYYRAGGDWDATTADELTSLLVECWSEQVAQD